MVIYKSYMVKNWNIFCNNIKKVNVEYKVRGNYYENISLKNL